MTVEPQDLAELVYDSREKESLEILEKLWTKEPDYTAVLDALEPVSLGSFSHRFPTIHVPKEHEYLLRILDKSPEVQQLDFLKRYVEYLVWSPKYLIKASESVNSGTRHTRDPSVSFLESAENSMTMSALFYINEVADRSLEEATRQLLSIGCNDVSQAIGHYFSCTESVVKLARRADMPRARNHLFALTLFLMQSSPITLRTPEKPSQDIDEILSDLIRKSGFIEYHYMILANGLLNQREFLDEKYILNAFTGIQKKLPSMRDGMFNEYLKKTRNDIELDEISLDSLKKNIIIGDKHRAFAALNGYLKEYGVTDELRTGILHSYTFIDEHPHDPHYVTVPVSIFELLDELKLEDIELAIAHTVEFAVDRIRRSGARAINH